VKRYVVHEGMALQKDGSYKFVSMKQLAAWYEVKIEECVLPQEVKGVEGNLKHLWLRLDRKYPLFERHKKEKRRI
jgi:hypothetical protein